MCRTTCLGIAGGDGIDGDAKVGQVSIVVAVDENVFRLEVAMDNLTAMCKREGVGDLPIARIMSARSGLSSIRTRRRSVFPVAAQQARLQQGDDENDQEKDNPHCRAVTKL